MNQLLVDVKRYSDMDKASHDRELLERADMHPVLADQDWFPGIPAGAVIVLLVPEEEEEGAEEILQDDWDLRNLDSLAMCHDSW